MSVAGGSVGLLAGGALTQAIDWHWIFFVNVPIGIVTALAVRALVEARPGIGLGQGIDVLGAVVVTSAMALGVYAIVEAPDYGWASLHTLGFGRRPPWRARRVPRARGAPGEPDPAVAPAADAHAGRLERRPRR